MPIRVCILGSTGSIGRSALDVVRHYPGRFQVTGLAAHRNAALLAEQAAEFDVPAVALTDPGAARDLRSVNGAVREVLSGPEGLCDLAARDADVVLAAMVGAAGLEPVLCAIHNGNRVALANKEPLVMAGRLIMDAARAQGMEVVPVDSEHNAIYQCLHGHQRGDVQCIHLTASGGPFYKRDRAELETIRPEEAVRHPTWDMGHKISVDSATLMNKGLEIIEAMWLFNLPLDKIEVVIHPQSIIHSLVEFTDGSILAHLGPTDMKFPILFALTWPERVDAPMARLDLTTMKELTFAAPDFTEFPCLGLAMDAARSGGAAPAVLNAANETAVEAFCNNTLPFLAIAGVVRDTLDAADLTAGDSSLDSILESDRAARRIAAERIRRQTGKALR